MHRSNYKSKKQMVRLSWMEQFKRNVYYLFGITFVAVFILTWWLAYDFNLSRWYAPLTWAGVGLLIEGAILIVYWNRIAFPRMTPTKIPALFIGFLVMGAIALPVIGLAIPNWLTLAPPTPPITPPITGQNATLRVQVPGHPGQIQGFCEVKLYQTVNIYNWSAYEIINISGNWTGTEFYHNGWLNADLFSINLTGKNSLGQDVVYPLTIRSWWKLGDWKSGIYTPPTWWPWSIFNSTDINLLVRGLIEPNETCPTWNLIGSGVNIIYLISEAYTLFGKIEDPITFQRWDNSDGAYSDNYTKTWKVYINNPVNETYRGFNEQYDWEKGLYYGAWLIASSNASININSTYQDYYGNTKLTWFNITQGLNYRGVVLNNSIIEPTIYDVALLLPTFNYDFTFQATIKITDASQGIHWYLGKGYENNIQILTEL